MLDRKLTSFPDKRLVTRGNEILTALFRKSTHSIRQLTSSDAEAKGFYRFLWNDRITEENILSNMTSNCIHASQGRFVVCIQDTSEVNLSTHSNRLKTKEKLGTTNASNERGLGFFLHPSLVLDAETSMPYGFATVKLWHRPSEFKTKFERKYNTLPIEEKESYKWIETSQKTKEVLQESVQGMVIIQDREGDIYEQFATIPDEKTDLLIRSSTNRTLKDKSKLFDSLENTPAAGHYLIEVVAKEQRKSRTAKIEVRYKEVELPRTKGSSIELPNSTKLYLIEAKEVDYDGKDHICWRLLTTVPVISIEVARLCIEWYSWRWQIEEVFRIVKNEGYAIESSELEYPESIRKFTLLILETVIRLFLMRFAYSHPEHDVPASHCFNEDEIAFLERQICAQEGKTAKQKNPYTSKDLKRYVWSIARLGGWKGNESNRNPGITTLWIGIRLFSASYQGWLLHKDVSTR